MKNFPLVTLIFVAILLFAWKSAHCSKPEKLPWQCDTQGQLAHTESNDTYLLHFETQPWDGCNGYGLGWTTPESITVRWTIQNDDCDTLARVDALPKDTIKIEAKGFVFVTCEVTYHYHQAHSKTVSPNPIWFEATGSQCLETLPLAIDTLDPTHPGTTTTTEPTPPQNFYSVQNGVISLEGAKGIFVVLDFVTMLPIVATDFQGVLIYDLKLCCGSGMYFCYAVFTQPYQNVDLGVVQIN